MIRRIILLLSVAALMAAMMALAGPASAQTYDPYDDRDCVVFEGQPHQEDPNFGCESIIIVPADDPSNPFTGEENPPPPPPPPDENCKYPVLTTSGTLTCGDKEQYQEQPKEQQKLAKAAAKEQKKAAKQ